MITPRPCLCPPSLCRGPLRLVLCACLLAAIVAVAAVSESSTAQAQDGSDTALLPDLVVSIKLDQDHVSAIRDYVTVANCQ